MKPQKPDYKEMNKLVKEMGLKGKDGFYTTKDGNPVDLSACGEDRLSVGYCVAKSLGLIK